MRHAQAIRINRENGFVEATPIRAGMALRSATELSS